MSCLVEGNPSASLMIIHDSPVVEDVNSDRPLVGYNGRVLWAMLKRCGIDRSDCYVLNTIGETCEGDTGPTSEQLDKYWDAFDGAARDFRGRFVLVLGGSAFSRYCGLSGGVAAWRGYIVRPTGARVLERSIRVCVPYKTSNKKRGIVKGDPRWVKTRKVEAAPISETVTHIFPTNSPLSVIRSGFSSAPLFQLDLARVARALKGELRPSRTHYEVAPTVFSAGRNVAVDIETGTSDGEFRDITRVGFATDNSAWTRHWDESTLAATRAILSDRDRICILHNAGFDFPRLAGAGAPIAGQLRDTMLAAAFIEPDQLKGLNAAAATYLDCERWKHLADDEPAKYNALDVIRTYELWEAQQKILAERGQLKLFEDTICGALPSLINMGEYGLKVDIEAKETWVRQLQDTAMVQLGQWSTMTGNVNVNSNAQLKKYFKSLGIELKLNKFGAESTDKIALMKMKYDYPEHAEKVDLLLATRHTLKDLETYAKTSVSRDGRVRASFVPAYKDEDGLGKGLAGTWRITAKEPNLQNQPKQARKMYIPDEGMCFVGADYSQLEARILAALSGDDVLQAACDGGIHDRNAELLGVDKVRAKNAFYGWGYLAGPRTLSSTFQARGYRISESECKVLLGGFDRIYSKASNFRQEALALAKSQRFVQNPFGFRRYFPQRSFPAPSAMSTLIQSTGAFMMWSIMRELDEAFRALDGRLLLMVHDDTMGQVPLERKDEALHAVKEIMERKFECVAPGFSVPVSLKYSPLSWGDMEELS